MEGRELLKEGSTGVYFITKNESNVAVDKIVSVSNDEVKYLEVESYQISKKNRESETTKGCIEKIIKISEIQKVITSEEYYKSDNNMENYFIF